MLQKGGGSGGVGTLEGMVETETSEVLRSSGRQ